MQTESLQISTNIPKLSPRINCFTRWDMWNGWGVIAIPETLNIFIDAANVSCWAKVAELKIIRDFCFIYSGFLLSIHLVGNGERVEELAQHFGDFPGLKKYIITGEEEADDIFLICKAVEKLEMGEKVLVISNDKYYSAFLKIKTGAVGEDIKIMVNTEGVFEKARRLWFSANFVYSSCQNLARGGKKQKKIMQRTVSDMSALAELFENN
jgi:hypothetical protein